MQSSKHLSVSSKMKRIIVKKGITGYSVADCYKNRMRFQGQKSAKSAKLCIFGKNAKFDGRPRGESDKKGENVVF